MTHPVGYLPQHVDSQGLVLHVLIDCRSAGAKGTADNTLGNVMGLGLHHPNIVSGVLVSIMVFVGPVGGLLLNEGPHEVVHYHELQMGFLQLIDLVNHLLYHEVSMDLGLGWTSTCQDSWVKGASLHPSLFCQSIEGGVITKLGLHNVRETVKE